MGFGVIGTGHVLSNQFGLPKNVYESLTKSHHTSSGRLSDCDNNRRSDRTPVAYTPFLYYTVRVDINMRLGKTDVLLRFWQEVPDFRP